MIYTATADLIPVFRVYVSGDHATRQTFDDLDATMSYLRAQALHEHITNLRFETAHLSMAEYRAEVLMQEERS